MPVRKIIQVGHPALKARNSSIRSFTSSKLKQLIGDLTDTMYDAGLIGIAAPQIAENRTVFVTHARNTKSRNVGKEDSLRVFINPKLTYVSNKKSTIYEGCGCVKNGTLFGPIERAKEIMVEAFTENGDYFFFSL